MAVNIGLSILICNVCKKHATFQKMREKEPVLYILIKSESQYRKWLEEVSSSYEYGCLKSRLLSWNDLHMKKIRDGFECSSLNYSYFIVVQLPWKSNVVEDYKLIGSNKFSIIEACFLYRRIGSAMKSVA